ncbi:ester cyclase [Hyalangium rubrum]|uniref:Ester cyclase n=1 Tax=Hyalangium rubrum TaxID=3103134 RepID=A0ABU5H1W1_9BACT|nr:ester cyclase [Hyalangium sp. s54d21]MDY7227419.1 ester cyclase [Hyalangium sp. s54d21]
MNRLPLLLTLALLTGCATTSGARNLTAEEENKRLARAFIEEIYNQRQLDRIPVYVAPDFVDLSQNASPEDRGPDSVRKQVEQSIQAIPDLRFDIQHLISEGDLVLIHWKATGTDAKAVDEAGQPRPLTLHGHSLFRMRAGQLLESWDITDQLGMLLQRGYKLLPPPAVSAP